MTSVLPWTRRPIKLLFVGCVLFAAVVLLLLTGITKGSWQPTKNWKTPSWSRLSQQRGRRLQGETGTTKGAKALQQNEQPNKLRILYTMTTLAEYDTGGRATTKGFDRLQNSLLPVLKTGVESLLSFGYDVDVFLVCHYTMQPERLEIVRQALPEGVGLRVWSDSAPMGYNVEDIGKDTAKIVRNTRALARQHRFVVKDNLFLYDFFLNFEDDMVIRGEHVQNHLEITQELLRLRELAPDDDDPSVLSRQQHFYGVLTKSRLKRMFPGLMRVEVLLDEKVYGTQKELEPVPVSDRPQLDPKPCCHLPDYAVSASRPKAPESDKLFIWETGIFALGVRKMPESSTIANTTLGWVFLQRGPRYTEENLTIGDYWSGLNGYYKDRKDGSRRPGPSSFDYVNNQGGWMATRQQIWEWHTEICPGGFLPPYEPPHYNLDGLDLRNVEYWSGGLHLFTKQHACNMQRIISLDPDRFVRHLIYHSANNKQRQLSGKKNRFVKVNDLFGQLNTVRNNAQAEMDRQKTKPLDAIQK